MLQACDASIGGGGDDGADDVAARSGAVDVADGVASCVGVAAIARAMDNVLIIRLGNVYACTVAGSQGLFVKLLGVFPFDLAYSYCLSLLDIPTVPSDHLR